MGSIGTLDRRVQFTRATLADDGYSMAETWASLGSPVWAGRSDVSDGEKNRTGAVEASAMSRFIVRSSAFTRGITPKDRMTCDGFDWNITGIKQIGRKDRLEISATARADQ
jgi:head-tail adaptor